MTTQSCLLNFSSLGFSKFSVFLFLSLPSLSFLSVFDFASFCKYIYIYFYFLFCLLFFFCLFGLCYAIMCFFTYTRLNLTIILSTQALQAIDNFLTYKYSVELIGSK